MTACAGAVANLKPVTRGKKTLRQFARVEAYEHTLTEWLNSGLKDMPRIVRLLRRAGEA
jgi:hypothetical protein